MMLAMAGCAQFRSFFFGRKCENTIIVPLHIVREHNLARISPASFLILNSTSCIICFLEILYVIFFCERLRFSICECFDPYFHPSGQWTCSRCSQQYRSMAAVWQHIEATGGSCRPREGELDGVFSFGRQSQPPGQRRSKRGGVPWGGSGLNFKHPLFANVFPLTCFDCSNCSCSIFARWIFCLIFLV